jgi:hypothetical protein
MTTEPPTKTADHGALSSLLEGLSARHPHILGYLTADEAGDVGLCHFGAAVAEEGERSLRIYLLAEGGFLALCLRGLDPLPGIEVALNPLLAE